MDEQAVQARRITQASRNGEPSLPGQVTAAEAVGVEGTGRKVVRRPATAPAHIADIAALAIAGEKILREIPVVVKRSLAIPDIAQAGGSYISLDKIVGIEGSAPFDIARAVDEHTRDPRLAAIPA